MSRKQVQVPNTTIVLLTFEVQYTITFEDATEEVVQEVNVKCDRLRLIAKEDVDQDVFTLMAEEKQAAAPPPLPAPIDENTGISVWQTVSVNVVDEDEEYDAHQKVVEEMYKNNAQDENVIFFLIDLHISIILMVMMIFGKHIGRKLFKGQIFSRGT